MQKAFRRYPIELAACADLQDKEKERQFFEDCKMHFEHIREVVTETFHAPGYEMDKRDAVLEPSYICEALGLQGRLDYMQRDMSSFIEMKSGKGDEYSIRNKVEPKENNKVQMLLYQAVLQYSMKMDHHRVKAYLLYTRYPLLYPARPSWAMVRRVIDLRNRIVAEEYGIQLHNSLEYTAAKLQSIQAQTLNERGLQGRFWEQYLRPSIDIFAQHLAALSLLEQAYFYALYNFITKEPLYLQIRRRRLRRTYRSLLPYGFLHLPKNQKPEKFFMTCASKRITQPTSIKPLSSYPEKYSGKKLYPTSGKETP